MIKLQYVYIGIHTYYLVIIMKQHDFKIYSLRYFILSRVVSIKNSLYFFLIIIF